MIERRFSLVACLVACLARASVAFYAVRDAIDRGLAFAFDVLARPFSIFPPFGRAATAGGPALAYDAPQAHLLRHEADTSRRAAQRNV